MREPKNGRFKLVAFDLDDTLCNYWDAAKAALDETFRTEPKGKIAAHELKAAWTEAFHELCPNLSQLGLKQQYLVHGAVTRTELMRRALARLSIEDETLAQGLSHTYHQLRQENLKLFEGALDALELAHQGRGCALITNGPADIQRDEIAKLGIEKYFTLFLIEGEQGFGKPDPRVLEIAEQESGATGEECLFVGNSYHHDILPAIRKGWQTAWIRRESDVPPSAKSGAKPEELPAGMPTPTYTITHLSEILDLLK